MRDQYLYVVVEISTGLVIRVYKNRNDIDDEYYSNDYSIQRAYYWR